MKKISLGELQDIEYAILCDVAELCERFKIRYGLCGGTLLGAVRHGGFIPWDDDIDIVMPRPDYERFLAISHYLPARLKVSSPENDENNFHAYGKVYDLRTRLIEFPDGKKVDIHVYIDIFPIDGLPDDPIKMELHRRRCRRLMLAHYALRAAKYKLNEVKGLKRGFWHLLLILQRLVIKDRLINHLNKVVMKYSFDESKYCGDIVAGYGYKELMPSYVYHLDKKIRFRERDFYTYRAIEYYLTQLYGDYMKLPPIEKRTTHSNEAYFIDD